VRYSIVRSRFGRRFSGANITDNDFVCGYACVNVTGDYSTIRSNKILQDGNFYGNNRMRNGAMPYDLGGTVQVDWGGNVAY
jgi:hypothetical protein